jgi:two-component system, chemotaxis family, chemotaxis protein CheY
MPKTIVLVGHCGVDGPRLQSALCSRVGDCDVLRINDPAELESACAQGADLLLVNREPLGFEGTEGVELIRALRERYPDTKAMIVTDFPEVQQEAVAAGAAPGFGKRDIDSPKLEQAVRQVLS